MGGFHPIFPLVAPVSNLSRVSFQLDTTSSHDHILVILVNLIQIYGHASRIVINTIGFGRLQAIDDTVRADNRLRSMTLEKGMKQR
jgi:hypothetical protein